MIEEKKKSNVLDEDLINFEKMLIVNTMIAEIGHELNNYLAAIMLRSELLELKIKKGNTDKALENIKIIVEQTKKMEQIINNLMIFSHNSTQEDYCNLNEIINNTIQFIKPQNKYDFIEFQTDLDDMLPITCLILNQFQQVLINIFDNVTDVLKKGIIYIHTHFDNEKQEIIIIIEDNGPGISIEIKEHIFDAHFTTKKDRYGLGLTVCKRIITNYGGKIEISNREEGGTRFIITLPMKMPEKN